MTAAIANMGPKNSRATEFVATVKVTERLLGRDAHVHPVQTLFAPNRKVRALNEGSS